MQRGLQRRCIKPMDSVQVEKKEIIYQLLLLTTRASPDSATGADSEGGGFFVRSAATEAVCGTIRTS